MPAGWRRAAKRGAGSHPEHTALPVVCLFACAVLVACGSVHAQTSVPLLEPKPVFTPGMYETESQIKGKAL